MGIPLVALMGTSTTHPVMQDNAVEDAALAQRIGAGRQQQAQSAALLPGQLQQQSLQTQLGQQAIQSGALDLAQRSAINDAWKQAATRNPDGTVALDPDKLTNALALSGHGEAIPAISKGLMDMQEQKGKLAQMQRDQQAAEADAAGAGAQAVIAANGDPNVVSAFLQHMKDAGYGQQAGQLQQHLQGLPPDQQLGVFKSLVASSPKQQQLAIEKATSDAKVMEAQRGLAELQSRMPGGPLDPVEIERRKAPIEIGKDVAEAQAKAPIELQKSLALEKAKQQLTQGSPDVAGKMLADRTLTIDEMRVRGLTPEFQQQAILAAQKYDPTFKAPEAAAQARIAGSQANQQFYGNTDSLLVKGGTLDQLEQRGKALGTTQIPAYNSLQNWTKAALGSGPQAAYAASVLGVADDYSKVMTGGQGSDTSRQQALDIISKNLSPEGRAAAVQQIRDQVLSQRRGRSGTNPYLKNMFPEPGQESGGQAKGAQLSNFHVNPKTGERIGWDGTQWLPAPKQ